MINYIKVLFMSLWSSLFKKKTPPPVEEERTMEEEAGDLLEEFFIMFENFDALDREYAFKEIIRMQFAEIEEEKEEIIDDTPLWNNSYNQTLYNEIIENSIMTLHPYKSGNTWMFDDAATGLRREAFVAGIDKMIEAMVDAKGLDSPYEGFDLIFSGTPFPTHDIKITHMGEKDGGSGNWYWSEDLQIEGWLCPALFKYFKIAPKEIYAEFR